MAIPNKPPLHRPPISITSVVAREGRTCHNEDRMKFKKIHPSFFFVGLLIGITLLLCITNYIPGTILSGWDTLHPEFNLSLYLSRITSVWQPHQGLGAPPSQAHLAEIPRMLFYIPLTLLLPLDLVRYIFIFFTIIVGAVGQYIFISYLLKKKAHNPHIAYASAFIGALYYVFNLGSIQQFIVILEMFAIEFAILGYFYFAALRLIDSPTKKQLFWFIFCAILSGPMGHTATLWYVFYGGFILFLISYCFQLKISLKKAVVIGLIPLLINLYWILPNLYYSLHYGKTMSESKINRLFSTEAYLQNKQYGTIQDLVQIKNFLFNWDVVVVQNGKTTTIPLLASWSNHFNNPIVQAITVVLFFFVLFGIFLANKNRDKKVLSFIPLFLVSSFFLLTNTPILSSLFELMRTKSAIFKEAFRFPFTKFSFLYIFSTSIFIAYTVQMILSTVKKLFKNKSVVFVFLIIVMSILWSAYPAFQGNYISPIIKTKIPREYFDLFEWSKKQDKNKRFLTLPFQSLFGWVIYEWDNGGRKEVYQGAGFTWFGIQQPTLNREFDRWYPYNEQAYSELFYATNTDNYALFKLALDKYDISYILLDKNVVYDPSEKKQETSNIEKLLLSSAEINLERQFNNLYVFSYTPSQSIKTSIKGPVVVSPKTDNSYIDHAYYEFGDYVYNDTNESIYFPGRDIINRVDRLSKERLQIADDIYSIKLPSSITSLKYPDIADVENEVFSQVRLEDKRLILSYYLPYITGQVQPEQWIIIPRLEKDDILFINNELIQKNNQNIVLSTNKNGIITIYNKSTNTDKRDLKDIVVTPYICSAESSAAIFGGENKNGILTLYGDKEAVCADISIPTKQGYLAQFNASFANENAQNVSLCSINSESNECINPYYLNSKNGNTSIFIPPMSSNTKVRIKLIPGQGKGKYELANTTLGNLSIIYYPQTSTLSFTAALPKNTVGSSQLTGIFPENQLISTALFRSQPYVCLGQNPRYNKKINNDTSIQYETTEGALCEDIELDKKNQKIGQILEISSENIMGIPFRICLKDEETKKCVLEDELSSFKSTNTDSFVIPPYNHQGKYTLILKNLSLGNFPSMNTIKSIQLKTFPYNLLIGMHSENTTNKQPSFMETQDSPVFYTNDLGYVSINKAPKNSYISLPESYEENWQTYNISDNSFISVFFAPLFGKKLTNHTILNNWSNAWAIPNECLQDKCTIAYVFLPIYLYCFGLIVSLSSFILLLFFGRKK